MDAKNEYYKIKAENVIKNFEKRNIEGYFAENAEAARKKLLEIIKEDSSVSWGGSMTLKEIEVFDQLKNGSYRLFDS